MPISKSETIGSVLPDAVKKHRIFTTSFASVYPQYVQKAEKKAERGRRWNRSSAS